MKRVILSVFVLLFAACSTKNTVTNYTIDSDFTSRYKKDQTVGLSVEALPSLQSRKIYWQKGFEKNPYLYSQWIGDFDTLVKKSVYNALFKVYKGVYLDKKGDVNLKLFITNAVHVVTGDSSYVILDIKAYVNGKTKEFHYKIPCARSAKSAVEAFNMAVGKFEKDLVEWLKG